ncbi:MAG: thiamine pyrophosphate-binding protein, partial [Pseudomonadota bacterium]
MTETSETTEPLGAQISKMLAARGVEVVFGIPGVHNVELYRGLEESGLRHVLARHEQGAAFMADGYARATGQPGVCYLITGPGFANAMTPLGQAYSDSVPVLALASCLDESAHLKGQLHQMRDQAGAGRTVCDWSETAQTAEAAYGLIDRALAEFQTARPRPKALHVPIELLGQRVGAAPPLAAAVQRLSGAIEGVEEVVDYLRGARRPLFIFGGGTRSLLVPGLMERFGAASFVTYAGRGLVPMSNPLCFGAYLGRTGSREVIASADLVVAVGTELSETDLWRVPL